jgi:class 3 adenylate cyclase
VALAGGAVEIDATFLYADMANSSKMAKELDRRVAAKILKSFLATTARLVRYHDGSIVSFDGDRILGVFMGDSKNTVAAKCGLQIKYVVQQIIRPKFEAKYESVKDASFTIINV